MGKMEEVAKAEGLRAVRKKDWVAKVEGHNGDFVVLVEIRRLTVNLVVVEIKKRENEVGTSCEIWKDKLRPQLITLIYKPEQQVTV
ncbi:CBL-interacting serine/threonine-protein kinase 14 [Camellia lanceoleosa]|uniref:CBL-interacting serine/threonine-protein kinase 14 n=1 Tax=Camellia lanceoleosa TaxID=1840588 RepID=A0ACC0HP46_9ERIC|nr:CBL-interacting serine/threonine-protein kinase 14 [Camellia lanceoleosa]